MKKVLSLPLFYLLTILAIGCSAPAPTSDIDAISKIVSQTVIAELRANGELGGGLSGMATSYAARVPETKTAEASITPPVGEIGQSVEGNGLIVTVISINEPLPPHTGGTPPSGYEVMGIRFTLQNVATDLRSLSGHYSFRLRGDDGTLFKELGFAADAATSLQAGDKATGTVYFYVPVDAKSFWLLYDEGYGAEQLKYPQIHITR